MECACIVYRANRLAPLAMNAGETCKALGPELRGVVEDFWAEYPETNVHFFVETGRFLEFLQARIAAGALFSAEVVRAVTRDADRVASAIVESYTELDMAHS